MGNIYASRPAPHDVSCDFCGTGTRHLRVLVRNPSDDRAKICSDCREKHHDRLQPRLDSGRYELREL
jgi:hypothetical protein